MSVVKVVELLAELEKGWEDAAQQALAEASKTIHGISSIYLSDLQATVSNNKIRTYRLNAKLSFVIDRAQAERHAAGDKPAAAKK